MRHAVLNAIHGCQPEPGRAISKSHEFRAFVTGPCLADARQRGRRSAAEASFRDELRRTSHVCRGWIDWRRYLALSARQAMLAGFQLGSITPQATRSPAPGSAP